LRVLAISGSLRAESNNTALLRALREEAPGDVEVILWDGLKSIPPYDQDDDVIPAPTEVAALRELIRDVDAVFFATPEYNSSAPGALKNALDWASRPVATNAFRNKPVAVISSSAGAFGGVWAGAELRKVLGTMGARVTEVELAVGHAHEKLAEDGQLADDDVRQTLRESLDTLVAEVSPAVSDAVGV
jgi:chromate reductase, NAD(P)H dehydrogenase (quinone)